MEDKRTVEQKSWLLFKIFFKTMLFAFTGGAVTIPIIQQELKKHSLMEEERVLELFALSQSIPGAVALNVGFFIGREISGWLGAAAAMSATILPAFVGMLVISSSYEFLMRYPIITGAVNGIRAASVAVIIQVAFSIIGISLKSVFGVILIIVAFVLAYIVEVNIILVVLGCGVAGIIHGIIVRRVKQQ